MIITLVLTLTLNLLFLEAAVPRCSVKKVFLKISHNSQENICVRVSFLIKLQDSGTGGCFCIFIIECPWSHNLLQGRFPNKLFCVIIPIYLNDFKHSTAAAKYCIPLIQRQKHTQNPVNYLRWSFLQKKLTAKRKLLRDGLMESKKAKAFPRHFYYLTL